jgi:DNA polymerase-3 subunit beta
MNIVIDKKSIVRLLSRVESVCNKKSTIPILSNALLTTDNGRLVCTATDLAIAVTAFAPAAVVKAGSVAVSARDLNERIKVMPDANIILKTENDSIVISAERSKREFRLKCLPGTDYPTLPQSPKESKKASINASFLAGLIARTSFAVSSDETRPHINSVQFSTGEGIMRAVSTDGHRMSRIEMESANEGFGALIGLKGVNELRRFCDDAGRDASIDFTLTDSHLFVTSNDACLSVKTSDAQFPPWQQVMPKSSKNEVAVNKMLAIDCLRALGVSSGNGIVAMRIASNVLSLQTTSEGNDGADEFEVNYAGEPVRIGFNGKYMVDALNACEDSEVRIGFGGELDPIVVSGVTDKTAIEVVMPMRIESA